MGAALDRSAYVAGEDIELEPVNISYPDCLRQFYGTADDSAGSGVTVGVIDMGIERNHPDLKQNMAGGLNTVDVDGEKENDFDDNGLGHGTHVAGIIGGRGQPGLGMRGLAPSVRLRSYRVYARGEDVATSSWRSQGRSQEQRMSSAI